MSSISPEDNPVVTTDPAAVTDVSSSDSNNNNRAEEQQWPSWPLLAFGGVLGFYLYLSSSSSSKQFHPVAFDLKLLLILLPLALFLLIRYAATPSQRSYVLRFPRLHLHSFYSAGGSTGAASPFGVALILLLLLLLISYHSSFTAA